MSTFPTKIFFKLLFFKILQVYRKFLSQKSYYFVSYPYIFCQKWNPGPQKPLICHNRHLNCPRNSWKRVVGQKIGNLDHYYALHCSHSTCTPTCWYRTQLNDPLEDNSDSDYTPEPPPTSQQMTNLYKHNTAICIQEGSQYSPVYICRHPYPFDSCSFVNHWYQLLTTLGSLHLLVQPQHIQQNLNIRLIISILVISFNKLVFKSSGNLD